ncbi:MAG: PD-(D/E)XK nuclease family protein [Anaerolineales bacterium]|nr:PD-(D/E)XK nuclease family protein [Anaerolineales bacterium]
MANGTQAIILENKIYAEDQPGQLARYYESVQKQGFEDISVIYLTLNGDNPSEQSTKGIVADSFLRTISYRDDIDGWLEECIKQASQYPVLRETLVQYQRLIKKLSGQSLVRGYTMEIKELLLNERNIKLAIDVSRALPEAKIEIQFNFWEELKEKLAAKNHKIYYLDGESYTRLMVENFYRRSARNRKHYGLLIEMHDLGDSEVLIFYVNIYWSLYYGFSVYQREKQHWMDAKGEKYDYLADIIVKVIDNNFARTGHSIGWKNQNRKLDFETFNSEDIFALADTVKRSKILDELVDEISGIINKFNEGYEQFIFAAKENHKTAT